MERDLDPTVLAEGIESDIQAVRASLVNALRLARRFSEASTSISSPTSPTIANTLAEVTRFLMSSPQTKDSILLLEKIGEIKQRLTPRGSFEDQKDLIQSEDAPPVWFKRVPKLSGPIIDAKTLSDARDSTPPSALEGFLDNMFSSIAADSIYEDALRQLRQQLIALNNRNVALELNLDMAEREVTHWRSRYVVSPRISQVVSPGNRVIEVDAWKHAIAKFIGSFDQFSMLKVLYHWRMHVMEEKRRKEETS